MTSRRSLAEIMDEDARQPPPADRLEAIVNAGKQLRDKILEKKDLEERVATLEREINAMRHRQLPDMMTAVGVDRVGLPAENNLPPCDLVVRPFYKANIEAGWEPERRARGFRLLEDRGYEDNIKTRFTVDFPGSEREKARELRSVLQQMQVQSFTEQPSIPWNSLTALVKTEIEDGHPFSTAELETLGATVGRVAELKERKA